MLPVFCVVELVFQFVGDFDKSLVPLFLGGIEIDPIQCIMMNAN